MGATAQEALPPRDLEPDDGGVSDRWAKRFRPGLALVAVAGLVGRLLYLLLSGVDDVPTSKQGDAFWYSAVAAANAAGDAFTNPFFGVATADHPPVTVILLTPTSWLFPDSTMAQRLTMVAIDALTVVVVGLAGRKLAGPRVGLVAAALAAALPALWVNAPLIMSEAPVALEVSVILYLGIELSRRTSLRLALLAGVVCGVAALTRAETGLFLPLLVLPLLLTARGVPGRDRLLRATAATVAAAAVIAPWAIYNLGRFDEPVPISTNDGLTVLGANCPTTYAGSLTGAWGPCVDRFLDSLDARKPSAPAPVTDDCPEPSQDRPPCWDASTVSGKMRNEGLDYARRHLSRLPLVVYARNGRTWGWYDFEGAVTQEREGRPAWVNRLVYWVGWAMIPAAVVGALVLHRRRVSLLPFGSALAIVIIVSSVFYGLARFRLPYDVASCLLVAVAAVAGVDALRRRRRSGSEVRTTTEGAP